MTKWKTFLLGPVVYAGGLILANPLPIMAAAAGLVYWAMGYFSSVLGYGGDAVALDSVAKGLFGVVVVYLGS